MGRRGGTKRWCLSVDLYADRMLPFRRRAAHVIDAPPATGDPLVDAITRAGAGDSNAFEVVYDTLAGSVHGTVRQILRDDAMSQEVTQEIFVEVWRIAPTFNAERGTVRSWVLTIARRRAIDRVRSEAAARRRDQLDVDQRAPFSPPADEVIERDSEDERVRNALVALGDPHRKAIELAYFGGLTYREVADHLGEPEGTVKTRIRDGMRRLRRMLEVES